MPHWLISLLCALVAGGGYFFGSRRAYWKGYADGQLDARHVRPDPFMSVLDRMMGALEGYAQGFKVGYKLGKEEKIQKEEKPSILKHLN